MFIIFFKYRNYFRDKNRKKKKEETSSIFVQNQISIFFQIDIYDIGTIMNDQPCIFFTFFFS